VHFPNKIEVKCIGHRTIARILSLEGPLCAILIWFTLILYRFTLVLPHREGELFNLKLLIYIIKLNLPVTYFYTTGSSIIIIIICVIWLLQSLIFILSL
jgi:hypothetical protein